MERKETNRKLSIVTGNRPWFKETSNVRDMINTDGQYPIEAVLYSCLA